MKKFDKSNFRIINKFIHQKTDRNNDNKRNNRINYGSNKFCIH